MFHRKGDKALLILYVQKNVAKTAVALKKKVLKNTEVTLKKKVLKNTEVALKKF
jgi:hypothetical protein